MFVTIDNLKESDCNNPDSPTMRLMCPKLRARRLIYIWPSFPLCVIYHQMSNQCKCRLAKFSPHRKEKCAFFGKKGLLISPDASDALYNKPQEATPVQPEENSKPSGSTPSDSAAPAPAEDKKDPPTPESQEAPRTTQADTGSSKSPSGHSSESNSSEHAAGDTNDPFRSERQALPRNAESGVDSNTHEPESSEAAKERLERLVAEAIRGANLPPGTSINVSINVNTPVPPAAADAAPGGSEPCKEANNYDYYDSDSDYEYVETGPVEAEPIPAEAYSSSLEETNDILASVTIDPKVSTVLFGLFCATK